MFLLDTDITSNFLDSRRLSSNLRNRILSQPPDLIFVSIITVEEMMRGVLAAVNRAKPGKPTLAAYRELEELWSDLHQFQLLPYTEEAERVFLSLSPEVKRVGTLDCRIAAIAYSAGCTVITANQRDFQRIGLVPIENWMP